MIAHEKEDLVGEFFFKFHGIAQAGSIKGSFLNEITHLNEKSVRRIPMGLHHFFKGVVTAMYVTNHQRFHAAINLTRRKMRSIVDHHRHDQHEHLFAHFQAIHGGEQARSTGR